MVGLPLFRKTKAGVVVTWGNLSTLVLWTQWDLVVAMMDRSKDAEQTPEVRDFLDRASLSGLEALSDDALHDQRARTVQAAAYSDPLDGRGDLDDERYAHLEGALVDETETGYSSTEVTHSG